MGALEASQDKHRQEHRTGTSRAEQTTETMAELGALEAMAGGHSWPPARHFLSGPLLAKNGCPKQDFIVVPPPSNIMEVLKTTYHRGQNRTLIKYKSK